MSLQYSFTSVWGVCALPIIFLGMTQKYHITVCKPVYLSSFQSGCFLNTYGRASMSETVTQVHVTNEAAMISSPAHFAFHAEGI